MIVELGVLGEDMIGDARELGIRTADEIPNRCRSQVFRAKIQPAGCGL